jgi:hypothetical protein
MTVAYNGAPNRGGAALFASSVILLALAGGAALAAFVWAYRQTRTARPFTLVAVLFGTATCLAFIDVAVTPENAVMPVHIAVTNWAFRFFPVATWSLAGAATRSGWADRGTVAAWLFLTAVLTGFVALLILGPDLATASGLVVNVVAQKIAAAASIAVVSFVCVRTNRVAPGT